MFDNNDFLNSYKKSHEDKSGAVNQQPSEEASANKAPDAESGQEIPKENAPTAGQDKPEETAPVAAEKGKSIWGGNPSRQEEAGDSVQSAEAAESAKQGESAPSGEGEDAGKEKEKPQDMPKGKPQDSGAAQKESLTFDIPNPAKNDQQKAPQNTGGVKTGLSAKEAPGQAPGKVYEEKSKFVKPQPQNHERRYYDGFEPPRKPFARNIIIAAVAIIAVIIAIVLIASNAGKVEARDFTGWNRSDFMLWAGENQVLTQIEEQFNEQVAADKIISQSIPAGEKVKKGDFIKVVISKGPDLSITLMLPDLMNMTKDQIEQWAAENFMTKVRVTTEFNDTVPVGRVIKYEINDNTVVSEVRRDTPIYIYISKGVQDQSSIEVEIPDFKTMGVPETVLFAQENGLLLTIDEAYDDYVPKGSIISQTPKDKEKSYVGDSVRIVVSLGKKVFMPDFAGMTKEQAMSLAGQLGINATFEDRYSSTKEGNYSYQTVDPGVEVKEDTTVTIYYSLGNKIPIVSYVGQQLNQLEQWIETVNVNGAKLTLSKTYTQNSAASGTILQQNKENTYITRGTALSVVVSSGQKYFVPDFVADSGSEMPVNREKAQQMCEDAGLVPVFVAEARAGKMSGEIWYQSISAGTEVTKGSVITLKYNPVSGNVSMPNFYGLDETQIKALPDYSKLSVTFVAGDAYVPGQEGKAQTQSITAGTTVAQGTSVVVTMGPVKVPDFTGMDQAGVQTLYPTDALLKITFYGTGTAVSEQTIAPDTLVKAGTAITLTLS